MEYRERIQQMARLAFLAYGGGALFLWMNRKPYDEEEPLDIFLAGAVFGAVLRRAHGGRGEWSDMQLAWVTDLRSLCDHEVVEVELDGGAEISKKYVRRILRATQGWL
jgi:hypothetical protein